MKTIFFDPFAGISGDMSLGALVDAGANFDSLVSMLKEIKLDEYEISREKTVKHGISCTDITVKTQHHQHHGHHHHGRSYSDIKKLIEESSLPERIKLRSIEIFTLLGQAEAKIHNTDIENIHFHEVGAVDAIVDIVGTCICLELLKIDKIFCGYVPSFHGTVQSAHGLLPLPAPATLELLKGVKWRQTSIEGELVTPTGAAIAVALAESFGDMPEMTAEAIGYGSGKKDFGIANVLRVVVGEIEDSTLDKGEITVLETNIDDISPQVYEIVMERLFEAGALDVYLAPIQMKKNRPAILLTVLCKNEDIQKLSKIIFEETSTIGIRIDTKKRICLAREIVEIDTKYGKTRVKIARLENKITNIQPEYEDCKAAALKFAVPFKVVREAVLVECSKTF